MTCTCCSYEWCWLCRKEYNSEHFSNGGNCEGLLYANINNFRVKHSLLYRIISKILKMILFFVLFPFFFLCIISDRFISYQTLSGVKEKLTILYIIEISLLLYPLLLSLGSIIVLIMIFYWPFQRKMLQKFYI